MTSSTFLGPMVLDCDVVGVVVEEDSIDNETAGQNS